ncbi:related to amidase (acetamidase) [Melanopsichium pennsylvanicum]|uniref:amidase n=2 Tax=Melanopsichium pennsylvanicum TaxID=63383 RepID=A0AAJ4XFC2_9BASI|nr:related to amidase (acetamidase) [Melanopsichium pennsylvanicum 4]SNX81425.1 related to amidase (acetamidase) [Melanopsichium pennsylvanicum]
MGLLGKSTTQRAIEGHIANRDQALGYTLPDEKSTNAIIVQDIKSPYHGLGIGLHEYDLEILSSDIAGITSGIKARRWTSTQILCAYVRATRRAQIRTNCLTEVFIDKALHRAAELDEHFSKNGELVGPLHGVPLSIKDMFNKKGVKTTIGFSEWITKPSEPISSTVVSICEHLGAITFVKTNIPQTFMTLESINPVFGRTLNPYSPHHTSGGSSGGESAIIACDGSAAGLGTDIAGSLRIPSHHTGIYTLKPSPGRWSYNGLCDFGKGFESVIAVTGPMCRSSADVETLFVEVARQHLPKWLRTPRDKSDPEVLNEAVENDEALAKFNMSDSATNALNEAWLNPLGMSKARGTPLRIGYVVGDGILKTTPPVYRAIQETVSALKAKYSNEQVEVVEIEPSKLQTLEALRIFLMLFTADGYRNLESYLGPDKLISQVQLPVRLSRFPRWFRGVIVFFVRYIVRDPIYAELAGSIARLSAAEHADTLERRERFVDKWNHTVWQDLALDAFIAPTQACPAVPHGGGNHNSAMAGSTVLYNMVKAPTCVLPVLRVDPTLDSHKAKDYENASKQQQLAFGKWASDTRWKNTSRLSNFLLYKTAYDAHKMEGLPVGLQVVARPYHDEKAIGIMRLIDDALPSPEKRGSAWKNQVSLQGEVIKDSTGKSAVGFGPGSLTKALFQ